MTIIDVMRHVLNGASGLKVTTTRENGWMVIRISAKYTEFIYKIKNLPNHMVDWIEIQRNRFTGKEHPMGYGYGNDYMSEHEDFMLKKINAASHILQRELNQCRNK